jgi:hypothetical protein
MMGLQIAPRRYWRATAILPVDFRLRARYRVGFSLNLGLAHAHGERGELMRTMWRFHLTT